MAINIFCLYPFPKHPNHQGNLGFCSRFALGKATANGFMLKKFYLHQQLDFFQRDIATAFVNSDKVFEGI